MPRPALPPVQLVTGPWKGAADLERRVTAALRGGIRWVQLRAKGLPARDLLAAARLLAPLVADAGGLLVVNDRVDVAVAAGAGGVHLPEDAMDTADARALLGADAWIGRSVHSPEAATVAATAGALDAVQFGPVFDTPSKRAFGPPLGLAALAEACASARSGAGTAVVAVGGITSARVAGCLGAGADAVAVIGAVWDAGDVEAAARAFVATCSRGG